jgi:hypothetical protein
MAQELGQVARETQREVVGESGGRQQPDDEELGGGRRPPLAPPASARSATATPRLPFAPVAGRRLLAGSVPL